MSTSPTITTAFRQQFHDTYFHALQQKVSRFQGAVTDRGMIQGSTFTTNNLGLVEAKEVTGRYQDKQAQDVTHETRIAYMADYDVGPLVVDGFDMAKLVADPTYKYAELLVTASNRRKDKTIYRGLVDAAVSRTTEGGALGTASLSGAQLIAAGGTGFTKAKILLANQQFRANECDAMNDEELFIMYNGVAARQIFSDTTLTSSDYLPKQMLESGKVLENWMGFTWIPYEGLDNGAGGSTEKKAVAWAKSGIQFGVGIDVKTDISENKAKRGHPTECYAWLSLGATRQDEKKVVTIDFILT